MSDLTTDVRQAMPDYTAELRSMALCREILDEHSAEETVRILQWLIDYFDKRHAACRETAS